MEDGKDGRGEGWMVGRGKGMRDEWVGGRLEEKKREGWKVGRREGWKGGGRQRHNLTKCATNESSVQKLYTPYSRYTFENVLQL